MGFFDTKTNTTTLEPMLTEEQKQAQALLAQLSQGGNIAGLNLGEQYGGSLGNFTPTATEGLAVNKIYDLLNAGTPSALSTAENTLTKLSDTTFDPSDPSSGYAAYQRQVARAQNEANDVINRESAITGNRFGDRILNTKSDLAMQGQDLLSSKLAELFNAGQNRALSAAQGLTGLAGTQNTMQLNNINTASQVGALQRMLDTAKAQSQYQEWQRARNEKLGTALDATNSLWNKNVPYGMKSATTSSVTPLGQLLNVGLTAAGTYFGGPIGGMIGSTIGSEITGADNSGSLGGLSQLLVSGGNQDGGLIGNLLSS